MSWLLPLLLAWALINQILGRLYIMAAQKVWSAIIRKVDDVGGMVWLLSAGYIIQKVTFQKQTFTVGNCTQYASISIFSFPFFEVCVQYAAISACSRYFTQKFQAPNYEYNFSSIGFAGFFSSHLKFYISDNISWKCYSWHDRKIREGLSQSHWCLLSIIVYCHHAEESFCWNTLEKKYQLINAVWYLMTLMFMWIGVYSQSY